MNRWRRGIALGLLLLGASRPCASSAEVASSPTATLKEAVGRVIAILNDPDLKAPTKREARADAVIRAISETFDFDETARRALGTHWRQRTGRERSEFTALFRELLAQAYVSRIERYSGESIVYTGESMSDHYAVVHTKIVPRQGDAIPVDYWMLRRGDRWLVYDISLEGMSLVDNYRSQFNDIIATSSYGALIARIKAKLHERGAT